MMNRHWRLDLHIHLDPLGGIAGDMFIAAMSNAFPELKLWIERVIADANFPNVSIQYISKNDGILTGLGFRVTSSEDHSTAGDTLDEHSHRHNHIQTDEDNHSHPHDHVHTDEKELLHRRVHVHSDEHEHASEDEHSRQQMISHDYICERGETHEHRHRSYKEIRRILEEANLPEKVREHSLNIFRIIGEAEAEVHGIDVDVISFHEVGGWDSVVDVVGAACVLEYLEGATWSYSSMPKGGGFIKTAHGRLPVPPPAVALLLRGFVFHDDGALGERVTPTGAAIMKYLKPARRLPSSLELAGVGHGFGNKKFPGFSNVLRVLSFSSVPVEQQPIAVLNFEIDDMTGEELSIVLENLRTREGVLDVIQSSAYGKKNRVTMSIQVLVRVEFFEPIIKDILSNTTTLGVRHQIISRTILPREISPVYIGENSVRVKVAERPDGTKTAKVEVDDLSSASTNCYDMRKIAHAAEKNVLKETHDEHN
jgi:pyridinium-3,5-bisthiocarboxylic acid mononucleotide nickel chelatase